MQFCEASQGAFLGCRTVFFFRRPRGQRLSRPMVQFLGRPRVQFLRRAGVQFFGASQDAVLEVSHGAGL